MTAYVVDVLDPYHNQKIHDNQEDDGCSSHEVDRPRRFVVRKHRQGALHQAHLGELHEHDLNLGVFLHDGRDFMSDCTQPGLDHAVQ